MPNADILFSTGLHGLFYMATLIYTLFTTFTAYHWFTYGSSKKTSTLSLGIYLFVSAPLFIAMAAALSFL